MLETCELAAANNHHHEYLCTKSNSLCVPITTHSMSPKLLIKKSFAYHKMPQQPLNLSVIKLDGSTFEVQVPRTATVAKLIEAVKDVFDQSANDDEMISWSHVWGHFCLCYNGKKLLDYKAYIRVIGIKDGDQLFFVRHLSAM
ncbi:U11/U12 small nuclear ribonucleoprotein 25 kDa protein-like [Rosa sericea]